MLSIVMVMSRGAERFWASASADAPIGGLGSAKESAMLVPGLAIVVGQPKAEQFVRIRKQVKINDAYLVSFVLPKHFI